MHFSEGVIDSILVRHTLYFVPPVFLFLPDGSSIAKHRMRSSRRDIQPLRRPCGSALSTRRENHVRCKAA